MTQEKFDDLKESHVEYITAFLKKHGTIGTLLTVIAEEKSKDKSDDIPAVIHIPIPPQFLENEDSKDAFVEKIVPQIFSDIKERFIPAAVIWTAEAWMRKADKDDYEAVENYKDLPITDEVLIVVIDSPKNKEGIVFKIKREGSIINSDGELVDNIELIKDQELTSMEKESYGGRFCDLFKKFND